MAPILWRQPLPNERVVITACMARCLKDKPSFLGNPEEGNREQQLEITVPYAKIMTTRMKGKPLVIEHEEDLGRLGEVIYSWVDEAKKEWHVKAVIDTSTEAGQSMLKELQNRWYTGGPIGEVSLAHWFPDAPDELSWVVKGARENSTIDSVELMTDRDMEALKLQEYKVDFAGLDQSAVPSTERVLIRASWKTMNGGGVPTLTGLVQPQNHTVFSGNFSDNREAQDILNRINSAQGTLQQQEQRVAQEKQQLATDVATMKEQLTKLLNQQQGGQPAAAQQQAPAVPTQQHAQLAQDNSNLMQQLTLLLDSKRNIWSKEETAKMQSLLQLVATRMQAEDSKSKSTGADEEAPEKRMRTAALVRDLVRKTHPALSSADEHKQMQQADEMLNKGVINSHVDSMLIRASAYQDVLNQRRELERQQQAQLDDTNAAASFTQSLAQHYQRTHLNTGHGNLIQASDMNFSGGNTRKRSAAQMSSSSSQDAPSMSLHNGMWSEDSQVHPTLAAAFQRADNPDDTTLQDWAQRADRINRTNQSFK